MAYQKHNWPELFKNFEQSGLNQTSFCKQHELNPKYFNLKYRKAKLTESGFVEAKLNPKPSGNICLKMGRAELTLPADIDPAFVAKVICLSA